MALKLGRTVAELEATLTYNELIEWRAYYDDTHFGELRADRRNAEVLAMLFNANRSPKQPPRTSDDYMVYKPRNRGKHELTDEELMAKSEAFFSSLE